MNIKIDLATPTDSDEILAVYQPYVENTCISFEQEPPTREAFRARVEAICATYPYLVCRVDGKLIAYAYAAKYRERAAYRFGVETSVYIAGEGQGRGIGKALYAALFELLPLLGYQTAYAGICIPNEKSSRLHEAFGFIPNGTHLKTGYKLGRWLDVVWLQKVLGEYPERPEEPISIAALNMKTVREILDRGVKRIYGTSL